MKWDYVSYLIGVGAGTLSSLLGFWLSNWPERRR